MAVLDRLTKSEHIEVTAREIDFVTRFARNWEALQNILGIMRPIRKQAGAVLKSKYAICTLQSGAVEEGDEIPNSQTQVKEKTYAEMGLEKYKKSVSAEAIKDHGYDVAVGMTDDQFLFELQSNVMSRFYTYINGGTLTDIETTFQAALAMANGLVVNKWKEMHRNTTGVVAFVNVLDVYEYLGAASITVQNEFGFNYIKNFMGYDTIFLVGGGEVARGKIIATAKENINLYYIDPSDDNFSRAGLVYTTAGETNLIGFHTEGNYGRAVSDGYAIMGLVLFAEYVDGIAVVEIEASGSLGTATFTSGAGTTTGTKLTISAPTAADDFRYYVKADATAPTAPSYRGKVDSTWKEVTPVNGVIDDLAGFTSGHKMVMVITNGAGQAIYASSGVTVVNNGDT